MIGPWPRSATTRFSFSPDGVSNSRGGGLPARSSGVIVFETKAENGKSSSSSSPKTWRAAIAS